MDLPRPTPESLAAFWARVIAAGAVPPSAPLPTVVEPFGDSAALADDLLALVIDGPKRATAGGLADYAHHGDPLPYEGRLTVATDGSGQPRAVLRTTEVRVGPLSSVDDAFAWDEGEGDRSRADWLRLHEAYFARYLPTIGHTFDPEMATVFERFDLVYAE